IRGGLLVDADARAQTADRVSAVERFLDDLSSAANMLHGLGRDLHPLPLARDRDDVVDRQVAAREGDGHPHTFRAVSATVWSFAHWSASLRAFPTTDVPKPHCGETARCSSGTKRPASSIRVASSSGASRRGVFVVTRPSTTVLSSGT